MARGKKKETLTPEERLQVALVPEGEQPYKVPRNWCWVRLELLLRSSKEKTEEFSDADLKYVGLEHMQKDGGIVAYDSAERVKSLKNVFHPQQILYGKLRPYLNKHDIATFDGVCSTDILVFNATSVTIPKFVNFFLDQDTFIEYAVSNSKGINLPRVSESVVLDAKCPLPPIYEQHRIVDRIESLFAKLDEAKQKAQDALDSFETRKAAILHKAFTGELTAQWRKEHGVGMESWERHPLKDVTQIGSGGTPSRKNSQYYLGDILWVKTGEIYWNYIYDSEEKITEEAIANSSAKLYPAGTVLVAMYGQGLTRGRAAILGVPATTNQAVCALQPCDCLEKRYLYYYFMANYWEYREKAVGGNQPNYSATMIGKWIINKPSVLEQAEIVRLLDDLLAKEQQAKETAKGVLEQIDLIKKAILARAFRGELGTNDPSEESAVELVKRAIERGEKA